MTWNIIKSGTGKKASNEGIHMLNIDGNITDNYQVISDSLNNHFSYLLLHGAESFLSS